MATIPRSGGATTRRLGFALWSSAVLVVLVGALLWNLSLGARPLGPGTVLGSLFAYDGSANELVVRGLRLPRALLAMLVGADLAVAGVLMQGITGNPLGAPEFLGVTAGAAVVVVGSAIFFPALGGLPLVAIAFAGAGAAGVTVLLLAGAGQGRTTPVRLTLAGYTTMVLLLSLTQGLVIFHENTTQAVFFWLVGGVNFAQWKDVGTVLPWCALGILGALALAGRLNLLALGDDVARGLGQRVERTRIAGVLLVIGLAGAAVVGAGPILFVGLLVPHIARRLVGVNHYLVIPLSAVGGATLVVLADAVTRYVNPPFEVPTGIVTALVGAPFFVWLARREKVAG